MKDMANPLNHLGGLREDSEGELYLYMYQEVLSAGL